MRLTKDWNIVDLEDGCVVHVTIGGERKSMFFLATAGLLWAGLAKWDRGAFVQDAFPTISAEEREFLMTGITPEEWDAMFGNEK